MTRFAAHSDQQGKVKGRRVTRCQHNVLSAVRPLRLGLLHTGFVKARVSSVTEPWPEPPNCQPAHPQSPQDNPLNFGDGLRKHTKSPASSNPTSRPACLVPCCLCCWSSHDHSAKLPSGVQSVSSPAVARSDRQCNDCAKRGPINTITNKCKEVIRDSKYPQKIISANHNIPHEILLSHTSLTLSHAPQLSRTLPAPHHTRHRPHSEPLQSFEDEGLPL
ncbi:hypothetical protein E2C01_031127 [Portunus trituberculatus]|uniref:Uncharacterized protein n=1 Tax=Portunus trituberculatus TaxID=210409 RepID=A0A5B7ES86_PORTR|nr:hypothetical protein [Portunus trituberculatus]